jgi:hypothetical protein
MNNTNGNTKKTKARRAKRFHNYCITSFETKNYVLWDKLTSDGSENITYLVYQMEETKEGKRHIQGYVEFKQNISLKRVKEIFGDPTLHCEPRRGTAKEASDYCQKEDSRVMDPVIIGQISRQGTRSDIAKMYELLKKDKKTPMQVCEIMPGTYMKYYKAVDRVYNDIQSQQEGQYKEVSVHILYGEAGAGKTRYVYDKHGPENVYRLCQGNGDNIWFDGYTQQKILIIDDYYGWIKYSKFLQLIDNYKIRLSVKGGTTYSDWDTVYITSNNAPETWYKNMGLTPAMSRRFKTINKLTISEKKVRKPIYNIIHTNEEGKRTTLRLGGDVKEGSSIVLPTTSEHPQDEKKLSKAAKRRRKRRRKRKKKAPIDTICDSMIPQESLIDESEGEVSEDTERARQITQEILNTPTKMITMEAFEELCKELHPENYDENDFKKDENE